MKNRLTLSIAIYVSDQYWKIIGGDKIRNELIQSLLTMHYSNSHSNVIMLDYKRCGADTINITYKVITNTPWLASLVHIYTFTFNKKKRNALIFTSMASEQSALYVQHSSFSPCTIKVSRNPFARLPTLQLPPDNNSPCQYIPGSKESMQLKCIGISQYSVYFFLSGLFHMSWNEVEEICDKLGGNLPIIKTDYDSIRIHSLMAGGLSSPFRLSSIQFDVRSALRNIYWTFPTCRYFDPLCAIFIGLKKV